MFCKVEAGQAWLEETTYQMVHMSYKEQSSLLAGRMAALKFYLSRSASEMAEQAVQGQLPFLIYRCQTHTNSVDAPVFGGRGITVNGMGRYIEQWQRTEAFDRILGGSMEVLADLAVRQAYVVPFRAAFRPCRLTPRGRSQDEEDASGGFVIPADAARVWRQDHRWRPQCIPSPRGGSANVQDKTSMIDSLLSPC